MCVFLCATLLYLKSTAKERMGAYEEEFSLEITNPC